MEVLTATGKIGYDRRIHINHKKIVILLSQVLIYDGILLVDRLYIRDNCNEEGIYVDSKYIGFSYKYWYIIKN